MFSFYAATVCCALERGKNYFFHSFFTFVSRILLKNRTSSESKITLLSRKPLVTRKSECAEENAPFEKKKVLFTFSLCTHCGTFFADLKKSRALFFKQVVLILPFVASEVWILYLSSCSVTCGVVGSVAHSAVSIVVLGVTHGEKLTYLMQATTDTTWGDRVGRRSGDFRLIFLNRKEWKN